MAESYPESPVDGRAIPLAITLRNGRALSLGAPAGEPLVLALFARAGSIVAGEETLDRIRAELRGLGAELIIVGRDGIWCFRPDDEFELLATAEDMTDTELVKIFAAYGLRVGTGNEEGEVAVYVFDEKRRMRFEQRGSGADLDDLARALGDGARAFYAASRPWALSRRELLVSALVASFTLALVDGCAKPKLPAVATSAPGKETAGEVDVVLDVNGARHRLRVEPRGTLLDVLRERLGLTGTKKGCDQGQCGACTVLVDGRRINSCLTLAVMVDSQKIVTIEGLAEGDRLHPVQQAFIGEDAFQCGFCTPGQIMSAVGLLREKRGTSPAEIREQMSGNICRCGAYPNIVTAIQNAAKEV
jgi:xanthine dehydrogenase YagT iron-sulfur-binding subunit